MAKRTLSATVIDGCTAETRQRHHRIRIEKLHKTSTRTVDCELFWLQNCYLRYFVGLIQRRPLGLKRRTARDRAAVRGFSKSQLLRSKSYKETKGITLKPWT